MGTVFNWFNSLVKQNQWTIAIVEDEADLREELEYHFRNSGFQVWSAPSAEAFYRTFSVAPPQAALIDLGLPGEDGLSLVRHLSEHRNLPMVILSARGSISERIEGLKAGADLYFSKPFNFEELEIALVRLLARGEVKAVSDARFSQNRSQLWKLDVANGELVAPNEQRASLTGREIELLGVLMASNNAVVSKMDVMARLEVADESDWHRINVMVYRLRRKTLAETGLRLPLRAVFGRGLCFVNE